MNSPFNDFTEVTSETFITPVTELKLNGPFTGGGDYSFFQNNEIEDFTELENEDGADEDFRITEVIQQEAAKLSVPGLQAICDGLVCWAKSALNKQLNITLTESNALDEATRNAIEDFQAGRNIPISKKMDAATERALLEADAVQKAKGTADETSTNKIIASAKIKIEDWTSKGISGVSAKPKFILNKFRDPRKLYAFVLHHMAFKRKGRISKKYSDPEAYLDTGAHFCIMIDGRIIQLHPTSRMIWHGNCTSPRSVAVEFEGNFPNVKGKWWIDRKSTFQNKDIPTQAQHDAGKFLASYLKTVLGTTHILAHRQSSDSRENDPGPDVWYNVGQWAIENLGMNDGGESFKCGTGNPILPEWRTWGDKTNTLINKEFNNTEDEVVEMETDWENFSEQTELDETSDEAEWANNEMNENKTRNYKQATTRFANAYLTLTGERQGLIKGSATQKGREGNIAVYQVHHEVNSPRDAASGMATGRRIHKPLVITKEIDVASIKLMNALVTNERIKEVIINFYQSGNKVSMGGSGLEVNYYRIKLTDAAIINISNDLSNSQLPVLEKVEFVYQKIEWQYLAGTSLTALDSTLQKNEFEFYETDEEITIDFEDAYDDYEEEQGIVNSEFDSEFIENEFPVIYPESITGASPFALQAKKQWKRSSDEMRPPVWQGKVFGLVVHTSGGSLPGKSVAKNEYPTVGGVNYYSGSTGTHYVNGWRGVFGGDLVQVGSELKKAYGVSMGDQRNSINSGKFEKDLSAIVVSLWKKKWPAYTNPMKLLPNITEANACYIHVECLPVVYYLNKKTVIDLKHPPMRPGLRFTKEQHDTIAILAYDIAWRNGWPMDQQWWKTPRLVGHEDLAPINRHDKNGGWDPGGLRENPYFDWDYVYTQIEKIHQHGYGSLINNVPLNIIPELKGIYSGYTALFVDDMTPEGSGTVIQASLGKSSSSVASTGVKSVSIDVKKAIRLNTYYGNSLDWNKYYEKIKYFLLPFSGMQNISLEAEAFAQAVAAWQKTQGFASKDCDGAIGPKTWWAISRALNVSAPSPVSPPANVSDSLDEYQNIDGVRFARRPKSNPKGWAAYGGGSVKVKLLSLQKKGLLTISQNEIDIFGLISIPESGGLLNAINSWDSAYMSMGFIQFTIQYGELQEVIKLAPSGFKKYGIELDYSRPTYTGDKKAIAILNAPHISDLRSLDWAIRFYKAGLEDDVVVAQIAVARNVLNDLIQRFDPNNYLSRFNNAYPNLWAFIYESNNSRPSILHTALKNAIVRATSSGIYDPVQFGILLIAELNTATSNYYHAKIYKSEQEKATRIKDELAKVGRIIEKTGISK